MPDDGGLHTSCRRLRRQPFHGLPAALGKRTLRIDLGADGVAVMNEEEAHGVILVVL